MEKQKKEISTGAQSNFDHKHIFMYYYTYKYSYSNVSFCSKGDDTIGYLAVHS